MPTDDVLDALRHVGSLLLLRLRDDAELRDGLRRLLDAASPPADAEAIGLKSAVRTAGVGDATPVVVQARSATPPTPGRTPTTLPPLTFASTSATSAVERPWTAPFVGANHAFPNDDGDRQRLALTRAIERLESRAVELRGHASAATDASDDGHDATDLFHEASVEHRSLVAHAFANAAAALRLTLRVADGPGRKGRAYQEAVELVAEALSALRIALARVGEETDGDHSAAFAWLKYETKSQSIYIARHMRLDDPADPTAWPALAERLALAYRPLDDARRRDATFKKLRYHAKRVRSSLAPDGDELEDADLSDWRTIVAATVELVRAGLPPSNAELRDEWIDLLDALPDGVELPAEFDRVRDEVERVLAVREEAEDAAASSGRPLTAAVTAVREVLRDRSIVVIGGEARPHHVARLTRAFALRGVDWIATRSHESHYGFEAAIRRPEVACVLLLIRWTSHSYAEVERFCRESGKPMIRMPKGYHPNAVATQMIAQAGHDLEIVVAS